MGNVGKPFHLTLSDIFTTTPIGQRIFSIFTSFLLFGSSQITATILQIQNSNLFISHVYYKHIEKVFKW